MISTNLLPNFRERFCLGLAQAFLLLTILGVSTESTGAEAKLKINYLDTKHPPDYTFIFSYLSANSTPIHKIDPEKFEILVDNEEVEIEDPVFTFFKDEQFKVAIVILFPISKKYSEEDYSIRITIGSFISRFRSFDQIGIVYFDKKAYKMDFREGTQSDKLAEQLAQLEDGESEEIRFTTALQIALGMFQEVDSIDFKYLLIISDGDETRRKKGKLQRILERFGDRIDELDVTPIVIAYSPIEDSIGRVCCINMGELCVPQSVCNETQTCTTDDNCSNGKICCETLSSICVSKGQCKSFGKCINDDDCQRDPETFSNLTPLLRGDGAVKLEVRSSSDLQMAFNAAYNSIFKQHVMRFTCDDIEDGIKHNFTLRVQRGSRVIEATKTSNVATIPPNWWLRGALAGLGLIVLIVLIVLLVKWIKGRPARKKKKEEEEEAARLAAEEEEAEAAKLEAEDGGEGAMVGGAMLGAAEILCCPQCGLVVKNNGRSCPQCSEGEVFGKFFVMSGASELEGFTVHINQLMTTIGSGPDNHVQFKEPSVSGAHAGLKIQEGIRYEISDFDSTNGTYVNGRRIKNVFLRSGDMIRFGTVEIRFTL